VELKDKYKSEFNECIKAVRRIQEVSRKYLLSKPAKNRWSALECIEHLNNSAKIYLPQIKKGIEKYSDKVSLDNNRNYKHRLIANYIINFFEPPYKIKLKTFSPFVPQNSDEENIDKIFNNFFEYQNDIKELIDNALNLDLRKVIVTSPLNSLVRFKLGEIFPFLAAHQRRHIWQAEKAIEIAIGVKAV